MVSAASAAPPWRAWRRVKLFKMYLHRRPKQPRPPYTAGRLAGAQPGLFAIRAGDIPRTGGRLPGWPEWGSSVSPPLVSLAVSVAVFTGALVGLYLHRMLPEAHLTKDTQDVVRLGTGMLSVLASLVLAMLISTAKTTYDTTDKDLRTFSAELILLDETLRDYGGDAAIPRDLLRRHAARMIDTQDTISLQSKSCAIHIHTSSTSSGAALTVRMFSASA